MALNFLASLLIVELFTDLLATPHRLVLLDHGLSHFISFITLYCFWFFCMQKIDHIGLHMNTPEKKSSTTATF